MLVLALYENRVIAFFNRLNGRQRNNNDDDGDDNDDDDQNHLTVSYKIDPIL